MSKWMAGLLAFVALSMVGAQAEQVLIPESESFGEGAQKERVEQTRPSGKAETLLVETGAKDGKKYRFFHSDGSGTFSGDEENDVSYLRFPNGNWSTACKKDAMSDEVWCRATREDLWIYYSEKSGFLVDVIGDKYPGTNISVRVDGGKVFAASEKNGFNRQQSAEILKSIRDGSVVSTRHVDWPHNVNRDKTSEVLGLAVVMEFMKWAVDVSKQ